MDDITPRKLDGYPNYKIRRDGTIYRVDTHIKIEGSITNSGYKAVTFQDSIGNRKHFYIHCLLAKLFIPKPDTNEKLIVDHIDRDKTNNKIENLRWVTYSQNGQNKEKKQSSNSKYRGVWYNAKKKKWIASTLKNGKRIYIGSFPDDVTAAHNFDEYMRDNNPTFTNFNFGMIGPSDEQKANAYVK